MNFKLKFSLFLDYSLHDKIICLFYLLTFRYPWYVTTQRIIKRGGKYRDCRKCGKRGYKEDKYCYNCGRFWEKDQ